MSYPEKDMAETTPTQENNVPKNSKLGQIESRIYAMFKDALPHLHQDKLAAANLLPIAHQLAKEQLEKDEKLAKYEEGEAWLEKLARKDGLTELDNRRTFEEEIQREVSRAIRTGEPLSLVMVDIDRFKLVNDENGHLAGDKVLKQVSNQSRKSIRPTDRACRYGGDEIVILLPDTHCNHAIGVAERVRQTMAATQMTIEEDKTLTITICCGVGTFFPKHSYPDHDPEIMEKITKNTVQQLISFADRALYTAKRFDPENKVKNRTGFINADGLAGVLVPNPADLTKMMAIFVSKPDATSTHT